jgi:hypothetical protein
MKNNIILVIVLSIFFCSCNSKYYFLKKYYQENKIIHQTIADSLMSFAKSNHTEVILIKRADLNDKIIFRFFLMTNEPTRIPIEFDSILNRTDPYPQFSSGIVISTDLIKQFKSSIYPSIIADSNSVFFGYNYNSDGNSQYGVLIDRRQQRAPKDYINKIEKSVYIANGIIP